MGADRDKLMAETESFGVADAVGRYGARSGPESVEKTDGKYKWTEVGVIPKDWEVRPLLEAVKPATGQVSPKQEPYRSMVLVAPDHIEEATGRLIKKETALVQGAISGKYLFKPGDIVYSKIRPYLRKAVLCDFEGLCSADMYPLTPQPDVSSAFIFAVLLSHHFSMFAATVSARSGIPKINREELKQYKIALPPLPEQHAIAEALSDVDALITSLDKLIAKKRAIKQAAMQQLLTGKTRLPGFDVKWKVKHIGDLAVITRGASPRPIDSPVWFDENSKTGWVRISDIANSGIYLYETSQHLSPLGIKQSRPVARNSLIMSICATIGCPNITKIDTCIHDGFVVFEKLLVDQLFLYYVLRFIEKDWTKYGQTGSQMNLNTSLINRTDLKIPSKKAEQTAIATVLSDMDAEITALERRRDKTKMIKQGMMQELLTGRVRLVNHSEAKKEPA